MGASDASETDMDWRCHDLFGGDSRHQVAAGDDVRDGVKRTDFVEVNEIDAAPVGAAFSLGEERVHCAGVVRDLVWEVQSVNEPHDVRERAVHVVIVC
jgi:hypothetical protein